MYFGGQVVAPVESARISRKGILTALLVIVILQAPIGGLLVRGNTFNAQVGREAVFWALTLMLILYIAVVERRPLSSVGLSRPTWKTVTSGIVGAVVMVVGWRRSTWSFSRRSACR
jgi:hypothetical protein